MNTTDTAREARSRNLARLRKMTIGTAALSVAAVSGFGFLAAATYTGTAATTAYTTTVSTTGTVSSSAATTTTAATSAPVVTAGSGFGHASSGGS